MPQRTLCNGCEILPTVKFGHTSVYIELPTDRHLFTLERHLRTHGFTHERVDGGVRVATVDFAPFLEFLDNAVFNSLEKPKVRLLPLPPGEPLSFQSLKNFRSLTDWLTFTQGEAVIDIIQDSRITTLFQPLVHAHNGAIYGYEALSRGVLPNGSLMPPAQLFSQAKRWI